MSFWFFFYFQIFPSIDQSFMAFDRDIELVTVYEQIVHQKIQNQLPT